MNLSGNWSGTIFSTLDGAGTLNFTLAQSGSTITGTSQAVYPDLGVGNGSLSGSLNNLSITATTASNGFAALGVNGCPSNVTAVVNSAGTQISGATATFDCTAAISDTFNVTKQ